MKRRMLALLLALAMLLPMIPMGTLAEDAQSDAAVQSDTVTQITSATVTAYWDGDYSVTVKYTMSDQDVEETERIRVVAAAYDGRKMLTSGYATVLPRSSGSVSVDLYGMPYGSTVQVFLLDQDNTPLCGNDYADWDQMEDMIDGEQNGIYWHFEDDTLTLRQGYSDEMEPNEGGYSWEMLANAVTRIEIEGITNISQGAFYGFKNLETIDLGPDCASIGYGAFMECANLQTVEGSVNFIGQQAFENCRNLRQIDLSACISVDDYAFNGCKKLNTSLANVEALGYGAFMNSGIQEADLSGLDGDLADYAFLNCKALTGCTLPENGSHRIGEATFAHSGIRSISFPESVTEIGPHAFEGCDALEEVTFDAVESIGEAAFQDSGLSAMTLPDTLKEVGKNAFAGVKNLTVYGTVGLLDGVKIAEGNDALLHATWGTVDEDQTLEAEEPVEETETVEETVPEVIPEAAVPETVEEVTEEVPEEELTSEEAAQEGYYIAPEGAQLQEDVALEEMSAFNGTDKAARGTHTATFTGLAPQQLYALIVSAVPGSLDDYDLKYIGITASDANGNATATYIPKDEGSAIVQLYGLEKLTLKPEHDYIALKSDEDAMLFFESNASDPHIYYQGGDSEQEDALNVYTDRRGYWHINVRDDYEVKEIESRYLTFSGYALNQSATATVRIDLIPESKQVVGAALGVTTVTHNYYSNEETLIPIFLDIQEPETGSDVSTQAAFDAQQTIFTRIEQVGFYDGTDDIVSDFLQVYIKDDHNLMLVTRELDAGEEVPDLKSSYDVHFWVSIAGQEGILPVKGTLKLNIQKKLPTLKAQAVTLNPYTHPTAAVTFTGGQVTKLESDGSDLVSLTYDEGSLAATARLEHHPTKNGTENLTVRAWVESYNQPVTVKVPVKIDTKAPTLKLDKASVDMYGLGWQTIEIPLQCTTKGIALADLDLECYPTIYDTKGNALDNYDAPYHYEAFINTENNVLYLYGYGNRPNGKQDLVINASVWSDSLDGSRRVIIPLKLTVNNQQPTLKLDKKALTMNVRMDAGASLKTTYTGVPNKSDYIDLSYNISGKAMPDARDYFQFDWNYWNNSIVLSPRFNKIKALDEEAYKAFLKETFTLSVGIDGTDDSKWPKVTVKLVDDPPIITTVKVSGVIDLNNDDSQVALTPVFKNKISVASLQVEVTDADRNVYHFDSHMDGDKLLLRRSSYEEGLVPGTYTATIVASHLDSTAVVTTTFQVTRKTPTVKVTGKLDSFKPDSQVQIIPSYKHYGYWGYYLDEPTITVTSAGKEPIVLNDELYESEIKEDGTVFLYPAASGKELIPAGKYDVELAYGYGEDAVVLSAPITVTQTVPTMKLAKSSVTIHPSFDDAPAFVTTTYTGQSGFSGFEVYKADGKTRLTSLDQQLVDVYFDPDGFVSVRATGEIPEKDTTLKIKLIPDTRFANKFSWFNVKVLGGKNLAKKVTLKVEDTLDPASTSRYAGIRITLNGFDNTEKQGTLTLLKSTDKGKTYTPVDSRAYAAYSNVYKNFAYMNVIDYWEEIGGDFRQVTVLDPNCKYRVQISYGDYVSGTADLKVAYGKNAFTVAQAPTLYKQDPQAKLSIHIDQKDMSQKIANLTVKGSSDFVITEPNGISKGNNNWTLQYTGDISKLKATSLTLQVYLKGNEYDATSKTQKPNGTVTVKVTVK